MNVMPEQRSQRYHRERLSEALREEIETILEGELADPRVGLAHVSEVKLAPNNRSAHIFISVQGDESDTEKTFEGLAAARGYIRHEVADRLRLRHPPELFFVLDRSQQYGSRIEQLLKRINKKRR